MIWEQELSVAEDLCGCGGASQAWGASIGQANLGSNQAEDSIETIQTRREERRGELNGIDLPVFSLHRPSSTVEAKAKAKASIADIGCQS